MSMSRSNNYVYYVNEALTYVEDAEIKDLILDIAKLLHDVEWYTENVQDPDKGQELIFKFRNKWFKQSRTKRLQEYINSALDMVKDDFNQLLEELKKEEEEEKTLKPEERAKKDQTALSDYPAGYTKAFNDYNMLIEWLHDCPEDFNKFLFEAYNLSDCQNKGESLLYDLICNYDMREVVAAFKSWYLKKKDVKEWSE